MNITATMDDIRVVDDCLWLWLWLWLWLCIFSYASNCLNNNVLFAKCRGKYENDTSAHILLHWKFVVYNLYQFIVFFPEV